MKITKSIQKVDYPKHEFLDDADIKEGLSIVKIDDGEDFKEFYFTNDGKQLLGIESYTDFATSHYWYTYKTEIRDDTMSFLDEFIVKKTDKPERDILLSDLFPEISFQLIKTDEAGAILIKSKRHEQIIGCFIGDKLTDTETDRKAFGALSKLKIWDIYDNEDDNDYSNPIQLHTMYANPEIGKFYEEIIKGIFEI